MSAEHRLSSYLVTLLVAAAASLLLLAPTYSQPDHSYAPISTPTALDRDTRGSVVSASFGSAQPSSAQVVLGVSPAVSLGVVRTEAAATASLLPAARTVSVGEVFALDIAINAGAQTLDVVDACINFDRNVLRVVDPASGGEMPDGEDVGGVALVPNTLRLDTVLAKQLFNSRGQVNYSAGRLTGSPASGSFTLATLHFKAVAPSAGSPVTFNSTPPRVTLAALAGEALPVSSAGSTITVTAATSSTPTAVATSTSTPTSAPVATSTPGPSPTTGTGWGSSPTETPATPMQPTATRTPSPTAPAPNPTTLPTATQATLVPSAPTAAASGDAWYFPETRYGVRRAVFQDYFLKRGALGTFGYPISREFTLMGFPVQMFQRGILQRNPDGSVATMNLLDEGLMPYTRINFSTFPAPERELIDGAPSPADPEYGERAIAFLRAHVPDRWEGMPVNFLQTFLSTVRYEDAFPRGDGEPALVPLLNLEYWGLPTSRPARDPNNGDFVYQRFQRGIMHYDAATGATQGLLLADYLKSVMAGQGLPPDLEEQARGSIFYRQYDRTSPGHLARPGDLLGSSLMDAFEAEGP